MGKTKFDLVTASKKKGYRITVIVLMVVGVLLLGLGLILMGTVTNAVPPNRLAVSFSNQSEGGSPYTAVITKEIYLIVDTGTNNHILSEPITFEFDDDAAAFLEPIKPAYRDGKPFALRVKAGAVNGATGVVMIRCGDKVPPVQITFTYVA